MKLAFLTAVLLVAAACGGGSPNAKGLAAGLAVINSDYKSTSVVLVDPNHGSIANPDCVNSGTAIPQATLGLSGDVALPSQAPGGGTLWLVDRGNGALVWLDAKKCSVTGQLK